MCDFSSRAFSQQVHATTSEADKWFVKKYAKEDQREQVMSIVTHDGTFAEVAFTASYPFCREYKLTLCANERIVSFTMRKLDSR
jgi:hypothetical protein